MHRMPLSLSLSRLAVTLPRHRGSRRFQPFSSSDSPQVPQKQGDHFVGRAPGGSHTQIVGCDGTKVRTLQPGGNKMEFYCAGNAASDPLGIGIKTPFSRVLSDDKPYRRVVGAVNGFMRAAGPLFAHTSTGVHPATLEAVDSLIAAAGPAWQNGLASVQHTGTDAVLAAIDMAQQIRPGRPAVVQSSYHGSVDVALGDNLKSSPPSALAQAQVQFPLWDPFFDKGPQETSSAYLARLEDEVRAIIASEDATTISCLLNVAKLGSPGPAVTACPDAADYHHMLQHYARKHNWVLIYDEVMCGLGRLGGDAFIGAESLGLQPDICTFGKGIGGGPWAISYALSKENIADRLRVPGNWPRHSHTYSGNVLGSVAANQAIGELKKIARKGLVDQADAIFKEEFGALQERDPRFYINGRGCMYGIHFLADAEARRRYSSTTEAQALELATANNHAHDIDTYGVMTANGPALMFLPALVMNPEGYRYLAEQLVKSIQVTADALDALEKGIQG